MLHPFASSSWIWPGSPSWDLHNDYALFRKTFTLDAIPATAPLAITADQSYHLYVNEHFVCRGPARGFQRSWPYDEIDIAPWLRPGENLIAIRAHNPGCGNYRYIHGGFAGLLVAGTIGGVDLRSDKSWSCRRQPGVSKNMVPTSIQLFPQESIDLRLEDPAWLQPGFVEDDAWGPSRAPSAWNSLPWESLEPRGIPMLEEIVVPLHQVIARAEGPSAPEHLTTRNLARNRHTEGLSHEPCQADTLDFDPSPVGRWRSLLLDLGKLHVGSVCLEIPDASGGEIIETAHYETLAEVRTHADTGTLTPDYQPEAWCSMAFASRLICRPGTNRHHFHHPFGFRYLILTVRDNPQPLRLRAHLHQCLYPLQARGGFTTSDPTLDRIWQTCAWTQRVCSLDAYVDTPWREQAQWWGDARVQAWNTFHLDGDPRLFRRGIRQIACQTTSEGVTYGHAPTIAHNCILPDFTLIWMLTLWDDYWQTGSLDFFLAHQTTIDRALGYFAQWTDPQTGLLRYDRRFWLFLDWNNMQKEGSSAVYNLWLLHALDRLADLHTLAGHDVRAYERREWAARQRTNLRVLLNNQGLVRDGILPDGSLNPETSLHAQTLALMTGLAPEHESAQTAPLLAYLRGEHQPKAKPSAYWITYLYTVLAERGHGALVVDHIRTHWAAMAEHGTTWENWNPRPGDESFSHAWSAHPLFHLMQILGGIRQTAPGWQAIRFDPTFLGDHAEIVIPSPRGAITARWLREAEGIRVELQAAEGIAIDVSPALAAHARAGGTYFVPRRKEISREGMGKGPLPTPSRLA